MPDAPDQGAAQTRVSATLYPVPHRTPLAAQWPAAPDSSSPQECEPSSVLSSGVSATSPRVRTLGPGPKTVVEWWAPLALAALPARCLSSLLTEGLPHDHERRPLGLPTLPGPHHCGRGFRMGGAAEDREIGAAGCASGALGPQV